MGATLMNQDSSRSHSVFTITVECIEQGPAAVGGGRMKHHHQQPATSPQRNATPADCPPTSPFTTPPKPAGRPHQGGQAQPRGPGRQRATVQDGSHRCFAGSLSSPPPSPWLPALHDRPAVTNNHMHACTHPVETTVHACNHPVTTQQATGSRRPPRSTSRCRRWAT